MRVDFRTTSGSVYSVDNNLNVYRNSNNAVHNLDTGNYESMASGCIGKLSGETYEYEVGDRLCIQCSDGKSMVTSPISFIERHYTVEEQKLLYGDKVLFLDPSTRQNLAMDEMELNR